jgi:hypothetical protein
MSILTLVTIWHTITTWTNILILIGVSTIGLMLANQARELIKQALLDAIQLYAGWQQAQIDTRHNRTKAELHEGEARLLLRDQRRQLLAALDERRAA